LQSAISITDREKPNPVLPEKKKKKKKKKKVIIRDHLLWCWIAAIKETFVVMRPTN